MSKCKIGSVSCVYHACMSDDCQYDVVKKQGLDLGSRDCETFSDECSRLSEIGIICFVAYNNESGLWRPMVYRSPLPNEVNPKNPNHRISEASFSGYQNRGVAEQYAVTFARSIEKKYDYPNCLTTKIIKK